MYEPSLTTLLRSGLVSDGSVWGEMLNCPGQNYFVDSLKYDTLGIWSPNEGSRQLNDSFEFAVNEDTLSDSQIDMTIDEFHWAMLVA